MCEVDVIKDLIPHRDPFLWVDKIISHETGSIVTEKQIPDDLSVFQGHYPGNPIMPGVLLCEAVFQSGALLMALTSKGDIKGNTPQVPVLTRISGAKFKRSVYPGDIVTIEVKQLDQVANAVFFKGKLRVHNQLAVVVEFCCAMTERSEPGSN